MMHDIMFCIYIEVPYFTNFSEGIPCMLEGSQIMNKHGTYRLRELRIVLVLTFWL